MPENLSQYRYLIYHKGRLTEDPCGQHVLIPVGDLREVYDVYYRESPTPAYMLKVRSFDRSILEEVNAGAVKVLNRAWIQP